MITSGYKEIELEKYFSGIKASFSKKFFVTLADILYIIIFNLPFFVLAAYWKPPTAPGAKEFSKSVVMAFHLFYKGIILKEPSVVEAWRCLAFSAWIFFFFYIYFILVPSKSNYQTLFSCNFGIKVVNLKDNMADNGKIRQMKLWRANLIPVFIFPIFNIVFFSLATAFCPNDWNKKLFEESPTETWIKVSQVIMKSFVTIAFFLQMHHVFTVSASKKALNWFVKSNGLIYVDERKMEMVSAMENKSYANQNKIFFVKMPGSDSITYRPVNSPESEKEEESDLIDQISV